MKYFPLFFSFRCKKKEKKVRKEESPKEQNDLVGASKPPRESIFPQNNGPPPIFFKTENAMGPALLRNEFSVLFFFLGDELPYFTKRKWL